MNRKLMEPYCIKKLSNDNYILLNRYYQPIGIGAKSETINYVDTYPSELFKISDLELKKEIDENKGFIFFYKSKGDLLTTQKYNKLLSKF